MLLTDKLVFRWLEGVGAWSLDSATPSESAYPPHVGGSSGELKATLEGHTDSVDSVAFSPDGLTLASGSYDNTIKLWRRV
jgi:WD40 repeat protein